MSLAFALLAPLSLLAAWWVNSSGFTLYFGDALAHLTIARRIVDSRTPGYDQIGTGWLPLTHALMLPFAGIDSLWRSGLAGAIPSAVCFLLAGIFLFAAVRRLFDSTAAAFTALAVFALNPNMLYMQSIPMTEAMFFACLAAVLFSIVWFRQSQNTIAVICCGVAALAGTLVRYDGWFLIPFAALAILLSAKKRSMFYPLLFCCIAALGPLYWLAHNAWFYGDPLDFYRGQWSAKAIYQRGLDHGQPRDPGDHHLLAAIQYYAVTMRLCAGPVLTFLGAAGIVAAVIKRGFAPLLVLLAPPIFYVISMYGAGNPIHVPSLWPHSYYNTRYGLVAVPLFAFASSAIVALLPHRWRPFAMIAIVFASILPWLAYPRAESWITWKESQVNSEARRGWTQEAADYLKENYHGGGILSPLSDIAGIYLEAGIPLREILHEGNNPEWDSVMARPDLFLHEEWAVTFAGEPVASAVQRAGVHVSRYRLVRIVVARGAPVLEIYKRN